MFSKLDEQFAKRELQLPEARGRGTQAAESTISQASVSRQITGQERVETVLKAANAELQRIEANGREVVKALEKFNFVEAGIN